MTKTLEAALDDYREWRLRGFSGNTWRGERPGLWDFVCVLGTDADVRGVTPELIDAYWNSAATRLAETTQHTRIGQLRSFLRYCTSRGWIEADPSLLLKVRKPMPKIRERLNAEQLLALIDAADFPQHRIVMALACNLALRGSEISDLRLGDLDLKGLTLRVRIEKTRDVDEMPISADLAHELSQWLTIYVPAARPHLNSSSYLTPSQYVHPQSGSITYRPGKPITQPHTIVQRALAELGWHDVRQEGVHTVRRSVARVFFDATEAETTFDNALLGTMSLLHHDRPETTLRYIGVDRQVQARNLFLRGRPFLSRLAGAAPRTLQVVR